MSQFLPKTAYILRIAVLKIIVKCKITLDHTPRLVHILNKLKLAGHFDCQKIRESIGLGRHL